MICTSEFELINYLTNLFLQSVFITAVSVQ